MAGLAVAVTGPTGEIGISTVEALERDPAVDRIVGMARRPFDPAAHGWAKTTYQQGNILDRKAVDALVADSPLKRPTLRCRALRRGRMSAQRRRPGRQEFCRGYVSACAWPSKATQPSVSVKASRRPVRADPVLPRLPRRRVRAPSEPIPLQPREIGR